MTDKNQRWIFFTLCWALWGGLVWLVGKLPPADALAALAICGSAAYAVLLVLIFFGRRTL